jgi:IS4 transposase
VCWPPVCSITIHGAADFAALSHQRWRIEEEFKRIKHRLALKAVSGLSWLTHQQDLAAKGLTPFPAARL